MKNLTKLRKKKIIAHGEVPCRLSKVLKRKKKQKKIKGNLVKKSNPQVKNFKKKSMPTQVNGKKLSLEVELEIEKFKSSIQSCVITEFREKMNTMKKKHLEIEKFRSDINSCVVKDLREQLNVLKDKLAQEEIKNKKNDQVFLWLYLILLSILGVYGLMFFGFWLPFVEFEVEQVVDEEKKVEDQSSGIGRESGSTPGGSSVESGLTHEDVIFIVVGLCVFITIWNNW